LNNHASHQGGKAKLWQSLALACVFLAVSSNASSQQRQQTKTLTPNAANGLVTWAMGRADAPVTLLEYGSLTCGHCAAFNNEVMPAIKRRFIDSGQVKYILRPLPTPPFDLSVAMHALTMCAGPDKYYPLVDAFFERQREVFAAAVGETGPKGILLAIAEDSGGLTYTQSEACLRDPARQDQVRNNAQAGANVGVIATPSIFVNGTLVTVPIGQSLTETAVANAIIAAQRARPTAPRKGLPQAKKR
jgi:protein-disulfide isomerase